MVIWLIGLSGAGKTTIGKCVYREWKKHEPNTVLIDGDEIREIFSRNEIDSDYSLDARRNNAERIKQLCAWLDRQGINVVCNILLLFADVSEWNRENLSGYLEVYVSTPLEVVKWRDSKGLYSAAERGEMKNVVGVDIPFSPPAAPDLTLDNSDNRTRHDDTALRILSRARVLSA
jgi:adenylylsulfate kinase-like enzyme